MTDYNLKLKFEDKYKEIKKFGKGAVSKRGKEEHGRSQPLVNMCWAQYHRMARIVRAQAKESDIKRVYSGDINPTNIISLLQKQNVAGAEHIAKTYQDAAKNPLILKSRLGLNHTVITKHTPFEIRTRLYDLDAAIAMHKPFTINMMASLHLSMAKSKDYRGGLEKAITIFGVASSLALHSIPGGSFLGQLLSKVSEAVGDAGAGISFLPKPHDQKMADMENFNDYLELWSRVANILLAEIDPDGEWVYEDFFEYS